MQDSKYDLRKGIPFTYLARVASGDPLSLAPAMERAIPDINSALRLRTPRTLAELVDESTLNERMMATFGGFFGVLTLIVASLGIFGLLTFQISRRINELGVRMALGASRGNIVGLVLREVGVMLIPGCVAGCIVALGLTRFAKSMLFGVTPTDPASFALSAAALGAATFAAGFAACAASGAHRSYEGVASRIMSVQAGDSRGASSRHDPLLTPLRHHALGVFHQRLQLSASIRSPSSLPDRPSRRPSRSHRR